MVLAQNNLPTLGKQWVWCFAPNCKHGAGNGPVTVEKSDVKRLLKWSLKSNPHCGKVCQKCYTEDLRARKAAEEKLGASATRTNAAALKSAGGSVQQRKPYRSREVTNDRSARGSVDSKPTKKSRVENSGQDYDRMMISKTEEEEEEEEETKREKEQHFNAASNDSANVITIDGESADEESDDDSQQDDEDDLEEDEQLEDEEEGEEDDDERADEEMDDNAYDAQLVRIGEPSAAGKKERKAARRRHNRREARRRKRILEPPSKSALDEARALWVKKLGLVPSRGQRTTQFIEDDASRGKTAIEHLQKTIALLQHGHPRNKSSLVEFWTSKSSVKQQKRRGMKCSLQSFITHTTNIAMPALCLLQHTRCSSKRCRT